MAATRLPGGWRSVEEGDAAQVATPTGRRQAGGGHLEAVGRGEAPAQRGVVSDRLSENSAETEASAGQRTQGNPSEAIKTQGQNNAELLQFDIPSHEESVDKLKHWEIL
ncbi:unnamed protein product [Lampetra planeri]